MKEHNTYFLFPTNFRKCPLLLLILSVLFLRKTLYSDYHDFTGAPFLTTLTIQHAIFNDKCFSSSLECPYNIQQSPETFQPKPPSLPPQKEDTGKFKESFKVQMKKC
jgi:hypothetical protein